MADSTHDSPTTELQELLVLEARFNRFAQEFSQERAGFSSSDGKRYERRLQSMRQRLNILQMESGTASDFHESFPALELLDDSELEQLSETLQLSVAQFQKLRNDLTLLKDGVGKHLASDKPQVIKRAVDDMRTKRDLHLKQEAQFQPLEDLVGSATRHLSGERDIMPSFLRIATRLKEMNHLNNAIIEKNNLVNTMSQWLSTQRQKMLRMHFEAPPSEKSLTESAAQIPKVALLNESLHRVGRARRYLESFLSRNGASDP